jgi:asparagine synthase (glutamine-hydrolysing)
MCGIVGFTGPYDERVLPRATELMHHRGPDDTGYYFARLAGTAAAVGMGHKRLSIIDLDGGHQPMWTADESLGIVFNGEIYNYRELRETLRSAGFVFQTRSDTEVILHGYDAWGADVCNRLEGMFAFAIWDARQRTWFLARDRFGIKPLYYCEPAPGALAFASEAKPLLTLLARTTVNQQAFYHYLLYGWCATEETVFRGIRQLPPAHYLHWHDGRLDRRRYWRLEDTPDPVRSEEDWCKLLRERLSTAVRSHLIADVPVGITLSGGLDSSAVLRMMADATDPARIQAFTVGFGLPNDELPFARRAAESVGVAGHERIESLEQVAADFPRMLWHLEEPLPHPVLGTTYYLARFVREHVKVVLVGEGSDELLAGYPHYRLFRFPYRLAPGPLFRRYFFSVAYVMPRARVLATLLDPQWLDRPLLEEVAHHYDRYLQTDPPASGALRFEIEHELAANQLMRIDKLMMSHSVEARVPFLDRAFAEAAARVPFDLKLRRGCEKYILRRSLAGRLPADILMRPKSGRRGTQALLPALTTVLRDRMRTALTRASLERRGWFQAAAVERFLHQGDGFLVRHHPIERRVRAKFALLLTVLEEWARVFLDQPMVKACP